MQKINEDRKVNEGVSLKKMNFIISAITIVVSTILLISTFMTSSSYAKTYQNTLNYIDWEQTAEKLQAGSDYLTDQVRSYVVTGKIEHLNNYFKEAKETRRRDNALELLEEHLKGTDAYTFLEGALSESNALMNIEYYAMALASLYYDYDISTLPVEIQNVKINEYDKSLPNDKKISLAMDMVFDDTYHAYKSRITSEVNSSIKILGEQTEIALSESFSRLKTLLTIQQVLIILIVIVVATVIILTLIQVIHPLVRAIPNIKENKDLDIKGAYEYRYLASTYNKMNQASQKHKQLLEFEATHDALTNVLNRNGFTNITNQFTFKDTAIVAIDVDDFKNVNDGYGHLTGDELLKYLSNILIKYFRSSDIICRMGGDEFVVLVTNVQDTSIHRDLIKDTITKVNVTLLKGTENIPACSISAGVVFGLADSKIEDVLRRADQALYRAKINGKKICEFYQ